MPTNIYNITTFKIETSLTNGLRYEVAIQLGYKISYEVYTFFRITYIISQLNMYLIFKSFRLF